MESASSEIRALAQRVNDISIELEPLERELELRRERLRRLNELFRLQTERLKLLRRQHAIALRRLGDRVDKLYRQEETDTLSLLLSSASFTDALDVFDYLQPDRGRGQARRERGRRGEEPGARAARGDENDAQTPSPGNARRRRARRSDSRPARSAGCVSQRPCRRPGQRQEDLAQLTAVEREQLAEMEALQEVSAELTAKIQAAQAAGGTGGSPSAAGFIWPVLGSVTSTFGWRWGRMHEGIDIAAGSGTPIRAAAAGTVIYAGWLGGYGNLTVIDHGGGIATAYGHQSGLAAGSGAYVGQGQVIGYIGSTGHSTGPHLHFEVRVNGIPQDPLGYLS